MTDQTNIERQQAARGYLHEALALLKRPKASPTLLLSDAANAVYFICRAGALCLDTRTLSPETSEALRSAFLDLASQIAAAAEESILPDDIHTGLGNALAILVSSDDGFQRDRIDYACILYGQLHIAHHRRVLSERGFPLARAVAWKRFAETPRLPSEPLH